MNNLPATIRYQASLILFGHILNPLWKARDDRRYRRSEVTASAVRKYLSIYRKEIADADVPNIDTTHNEPEHVFAIWLQGEENAPESVKACFRSMRSHLQLPLVVLDKDTLFDWITLPEYIVEKWKSGKMGNAHFSDICRVELLYNHGGLWFDATDYVTAPVPDYIMDSDFFVFMGGSKIMSWYGFIQNCFIRARKGNQLLGLWREAMFTYWKHEDKIITYLGHQILFQYLIEVNEKAATLFLEMPKMVQDPTHVLWYEHKDDSFDSNKYREYTDATFFQKTDFKDSSARNPLSGTMAAYMFASGNNL